MGKQVTLKLSLIGGMGVVGTSVFLLTRGALLEQPVITQQVTSASPPSRRLQNTAVPTPVPRFPANTRTVDLGQDKSERLAFLTPDQREQTARLETSYSNRLATILGDRAKPTRQDLTALAEMEKERRAEIVKILGPVLAEQYELVQSRTAIFIRKTTGDFEMTEQEFRKLYAIRVRWEDQHGPSYIAVTTETLAAKVELEHQMRQALGEERYTQYMREQNWVVSTLQTVANDYSIPKETAVLVFDLKPAAQEQVVQIRANLDLSPEQRLAALQAVQTRTLQAIAHLMGKEATEAYYRQGSWIRNLTQDVPVESMTQPAMP